ncbi:MAG: hypothetical protein ACOYKN_16015 [Pirellula sp.]|jgi:hypothetical protein
MTAAPTSDTLADHMLAIAKLSDDDDSECSSIQIDQPDRLTELNARYDQVLAEIDALDSRIQRLLKEISVEKPANFQA